MSLVKRGRSRYNGVWGSRVELNMSWLIFSHNQWGTALPRPLHTLEMSPSSPSLRPRPKPRPHRDQECLDHLIGSMWRRGTKTKEYPGWDETRTRSNLKTQAVLQYYHSNTHIHIHQTTKHKSAPVGAVGEVLLFFPCWPIFIFIFLIMRLKYVIVTK